MTLDPDGHREPSGPLTRWWARATGDVPLFVPRPKDHVMPDRVTATRRGDVVRLTDPHADPPVDATFEVVDVSPGGDRLRLRPSPPEDPMPDPDNLPIDR